MIALAAHTGDALYGSENARHRMQRVHGAVPDGAAVRLLEVPRGVYLGHALAHFPVCLLAMPEQNALGAADGPRGDTDLAGEDSLSNASESGSGHLSGGRDDLYAVFLSLLDKLRRLCRRDGHGLVEMYMLAGAYRLHALLKVDLDRRSQSYKVNVGVLEQFVIVGIIFRDAELLRTVLRSARDGIHYSRGIDEIALVLLAGMLKHGLYTGRAAADYAYSQRLFVFHCSPSCFYCFVCLSPLPRR